ncbi:hypothetical protein LZ31DRAFT_62017 [Colletotrichum somersetense]|nr:hypothetical protein LZ31DRAFT_62017 [Colletotrichum somersetense]
MSASWFMVRGRAFAWSSVEELASLQHSSPKSDICHFLQPRTPECGFDDMGRMANGMASSVALVRAVFPFTNIPTDNPEARQLQPKQPPQAASRSAELYISPFVIRWRPLLRSAACLRAVCFDVALCNGPQNKTVTKQTKSGGTCLPSSTRNGYHFFSLH